MQAFHIPAPPPYYTNTFFADLGRGHAVIIDPAADVAELRADLQVAQRRAHHSSVHPSATLTMWAAPRPAPEVPRRALLRSG